MLADKKIIVAYDGSPDSKKALEMAAGLAKDFAANIFLVSVFHLPTVLIEGMDVGWATDPEKFYAEKIKDGKKYCEEQGINIQTKVLLGNPAEEIIKFAQKENAYLIIAGTRGLGGFNQLLVGSVAHQLITYSSVPVMIVK